LWQPRAPRQRRRQTSTAGPTHCLPRERFVHLSQTRGACQHPCRHRESSRREPAWPRSAKDRAGSVALVYGLARTAYRDQFAQRDQQRTRCSALLAFAGILATLSITAARDAHGSLLIFIGIIALIAAAGLFFAGIIWFSLEITPRFRKLADDYLFSSRRDTELQILGNTVDVIRGNERTLQRADSLFGFAVLLLFLGTLLIGAQVALLLLKEAS